MGSRTAIDPVVRRFRERLPKSVRVSALIWFGSRSRGGGDEWSDYDFIVVSPDFEGIPFLQRSRKLSHLREPRRSYDFLCYTPKEFEEMVNSITIVREAARTGIRII